MPQTDVGKKVNLYVEDWGAGKQIVFIHGWPFDHRIFEYQMLGLSQRDYRVVAIDLRGFGGSDKPWAGNDYDTWASDVGKVMNALALRDVTLVGFSIGGAIAAHHLARFRDTRVSKLALISAPVPAAWVRFEDTRALEDMIREVLADKAKSISDFVMRMFHTPTSPEYRDSLAAMGRAASLRASIRALEELRDRNLQAEIGNIRYPTRIFHGVHDEFFPFSLAEQQQRSIKEATLVPFESSGHGVFWDEKDKLIDELAKFVDQKLAKAA